MHMRREVLAPRGASVLGAAEAASGPEWKATSVTKRVSILGTSSIMRPFSRGTGVLRAALS